MLDLRRRSIVFELSGTWYLVTFRTQPLGRVKDIKVSQSSQPSGLFYPCAAKIESQYISTPEVLKMFWDSIWTDIKVVVKQHRQRGLSLK